MPTTFSSIGITNRPRAQRDTKASVGLRLSTTELTRSSRLNSRGIDCQACPSLRLCTQSLRHVRRTVTIRPKEQYEALQARREPRNNQGLQIALCDACRGRGDHFARGPNHGITPLALHWARAHTSTTCGDSGSYQRRSSHPLVGWCPSCEDQAVTLCSTTPPGCLNVWCEIERT